MNNLFVTNQMDLKTRLKCEKSYWKLLNENKMCDSYQASSFKLPQLLNSIKFGENFILKSASSLLLNSLEWVKNSNNAFKLFE